MFSLENAKYIRSNSMRDGGAQVLSVEISSVPFVLYLLRSFQDKKTEEYEHVRIYSSSWDEPITVQIGEIKGLKTFFRENIGRIPELVSRCWLRVVAEKAV